jgi:hypothetical protein
MKTARPFILLFLCQLLIGCIDSTNMAFKLETYIPYTPVQPEYPRFDPQVAVQSDLSMGNREYVTSALKQIFTPSGNETSLDSILSLEVRGQLGIFGGACNLYSSAGLTDCGLQTIGQTDTLDINAAFTQSSSTLREARRLRACDQIVDRGDALSAALAKIPGATTLAVPTDAQIDGAYELFYMGQRVSSEVHSALAAIAANADDGVEAWQLIFYTLCTSPGWQVL